MEVWLTINGNGEAYNLLLQQLLDTDLHVLQDRPRAYSALFPVGFAVPERGEGVAGALTRLATLTLSLTLRAARTGYEVRHQETVIFDLLDLSIRSIYT